jgi:multicomponent Na+:H+ antiporter subunit D
VSLPALASLIVVDAPLVVSLAAALMLLGLMLKTALFPFHFWLPPAHGGAPAPVSALLSALVIKASFYLILRLWFDVFAPIVSVTAAQLVGALGAGAVLWGSLLALRQTQLKMLVAYSTVAQVGYLFLLLPLATGTTAAVTTSAWQGGVLQVVTHGLAKAAMFAAAGAMITATGRNEIAGIAGVATRLPLTLFSFALASVTIMGLPPSGGFAAKWLLLSAALASGQWWWIVVMVAGGLLSAAYVFKVLRQAFLPAEAASRFKVLPRMLEWPSFLLALASLLLGLAAGELLHLLDAA